MKFDYRMTLFQGRFSAFLAYLKTRFWAKLFFVLSVWYAVLVDLPFALEQIIAQQWRIKNALKSYQHLYEFVFGPFITLLHRINTSYQFPWFKVGKDLLFICSISFLLLYLAREGYKVYKFKESAVTITYLILITLIPLLAIASLLRHGLWTVLAGLRLHLTLLAFFLGLCLDQTSLRKIWVWLIPLFIVQFIFVLAQTEFYRTAGTFRNPNTFGLFLVVFLLPLFIFEFPPWFRFSVWGMAAFMLIRSKSRMAIILGLIVLGVYFWTRVRKRWIRWIILGLLFLFYPYLVLALETITGREDLINDFIRVRVLGMSRYFFRFALESSSPFIRVLFGEGLGRGTKVLRMLAPVVGISPDWGWYDNQIGGLLVSGGLLLVLVTLAFVVSPILTSRQGYYGLALSAFTFAALWAIPLWEAWPANLLTLLLYGHFVNFSPNRRGLGVHLERSNSSYS